MMNTYLAIGMIENGYVSRQFSCDDDNALVESALSALADTNANIEHLLIVQNNEIVLDESC